MNYFVYLILCNRYYTNSFRVGFSNIGSWRFVARRNLICQVGTLTCVKPIKSISCFFTLSLVSSSLITNVLNVSLTFFYLSALWLKPMISLSCLYTLKTFYHNSLFHISSSGYSILFCIFISIYIENNWIVYFVFSHRETLIINLGMWFMKYIKSYLWVITS